MASFPCCHGSTWVKQSVPDWVPPVFPRDPLQSLDGQGKRSHWVNMSAQMCGASMRPYNCGVADLVMLICHATEDISRTPTEARGVSQCLQTAADWHLYAQIWDDKSQDRTRLQGPWSVEDENQTLEKLWLGSWQLCGGSGPFGPPQSCVGHCPRHCAVVPLG